MPSFTYTTQSQVRAAFWEAHPQFRKRPAPAGTRWPQNAYNTDTRCAFVNWVDSLARDGAISAALADRVTL